MPGPLSYLLICVLASSVDAEHAFSGGRLQINHLQHGTSSQTFKAQMAVGSWTHSDIFPTLEPFVKIERESGWSRKGKEKVVIDDTNDNTDFKWKEENYYN